MIDPEFIQRATEMAKPFLEEYKYNEPKNVWIRNNHDKFKKLQKKYFDSEKGQYAISKRESNRRNKFETAKEGITWEEKKLIGRFYINCPKDYEVDHIIPVSKDGKHTLSNLQYLTKEENRRKSAKLDWKKS